MQKIFCFELLEACQAESWDYQQIKQIRIITVKTGQHKTRQNDMNGPAKKKVCSTDSDMSINTPR